MNVSFPVGYTHMRSNVVVAALYAFPVLAVLGIWYVLLFDADGSATPRGILTYVLTEAPERQWFHWLLAAPVLWATVAIAHLTPVAARRTGSVALNCAGACLALVAWFTLTFSIALFASLPLMYAAGRAIAARR